jgi:hypothetical protein
MLALMHILYPQALTAVQGASSVASLRTSDWTLPYDEEVKYLEDVAKDIKAFIDQNRSSGGLSTAPLVVSFPKPGTASAVPAALTASPERLGGVWKPCPSGTGYCLRENPVFAIGPEDVYGHPLIGLGCGEAAPVVEGFAAIAVSRSDGNDDWNNNARRADIARSPDMQFPTENGIVDYRTDGDFGILAPSRVRVLAGESADVANKFAQYVRNVGDLHGVSPFNTFSLTLGPAVSDRTSPLATASEIVVFFDVQTRTATAALAGLGVCAP